MALHETEYIKYKQNKKQSYAVEQYYDPKANLNINP